jgi:hypothetical protein
MITNIIIHYALTKGSYGFIHSMKNSFFVRTNSIAGYTIAPNLYVWVVPSCVRCRHEQI